MTVRIDPENNEARALFDLADFEGKDVLEIGSGDGRLTWLYAHKAKNVTAVEPYARSLARAAEDLPMELKGRVDFHHSTFETYAADSDPAAFDTVILSWSLC